MDTVTVETTAFRDAGSITLESRGGLDIRNSALSVAAIAANAGTVDLKAGESITLTDTRVFAHVAVDGGGSITMAAPIISLSGGGLFIHPGLGLSGTISLSATKSVSLSNGTRLCCGGTILINGGNLFTAQQSIIEGNEFFGDTIQVQAKRIELTDSQLITDCFYGGGHITLDAKNTTMTNSQILSRSSGGSGGTITINSPGFHQDANSVIDASSQSGTNGTVTINGVSQP